MLAVRINLISRRKRKRINDIVTFLFLKHIIEILLLVLTVVAMALVLGQQLLESNFSTFAESYTSTLPQRGAINREAALLNKQISQIHEVQKEFVPWSIALHTIGELTPADITWSRWSFDKQQRSATLQGTARSRESVLELETLMRSQPWVENIQIPLSEIINAGGGQDTPFEITMLLTLHNISY